MVRKISPNHNFNDDIVKSFGTKNFPFHKILIREGYLESLTNKELLQLVDNFETSLNKTSMIQCEYKILHEIKKYIIDELKNREDMIFQNAINKLEKMREISFLTGRYSILTKIIQTNKIDIFSPCGLIDLLKLVNYNKLNFFDLEDLVNLGDNYAKRLLKEEIIKLVLNGPLNNADSLIQCGYFDYLDVNEIDIIMENLSYENLEINSLKILEGMENSKAKQILTKKQSP